MSVRDDFEITKDALTHYSKRLQELKNDEDVAKGNDMIQEDIETNSKELLEIANHLESKSSNTFKDYREVICSALTLYQKDLENSKKTLLEKLGENVRFKWDKIDDEIKKVEAIKKFCDCKNDDWNWVSV